MQSQIKCDYCKKFAEPKDVMRFYPFKFIHKDEHGCLVKHLQENHPQVLEQILNGGEEK